MVRVVDPGPHHTVVKEVVCRNCGAKLEYVPRDIRSRRYTDYGGGSDTHHWIDCPPCGNEVAVTKLYY